MQRRFAKPPVQDHWKRWVAIIASVIGVFLFKPAPFMSPASVGSGFMVLIAILILCALVAGVVYLGVQLAKRTARVPAFERAVVSVACTLLGYMGIMWFGIPIDEPIGMALFAIGVGIPFVCLVTGIILYLRSDEKASPFLVTRMFNAMPTSMRIVMDTLGIVALTALGLILIFRGEEIPKFAYNLFERESDSIVNTMHARSTDISLLADRRNNMRLSLADMRSVAAMLSEAVDKQTAMIASIERIAQRQSSIPFLPESYRTYHETKLQWIRAYRTGHESFTKRERLLYRVDELSKYLDEAVQHKNDVVMDDPANRSEHLTQAWVMSKQVRESIERMRTEGLVTEAMEDYFVIRAKMVGDTIDVIESAGDTMDLLKPETLAQLQRIGARDDALDADAAFSEWDTRFTVPLAEARKMAIDEADRLHADMWMYRTHEDELPDAIMPVLTKWGILKKTVFDHVPALPIRLTEGEMDDYRKLMDSAPVKTIQSVLDAYHEGKDLGPGIIPEAIKPMEVGDITMGLTSFDRERLSGSFVVISADEDGQGGEVVTMMMRHTPDMIYYAHMRKRPDGSYVIGQIASPMKQDASQLRFYRETLRYFFEQQK